MKKKDWFTVVLMVIWGLVVLALWLVWLVVIIPMEHEPKIQDPVAEIISVKLPTIESRQPVIECVEVNEPEIQTYDSMEMLAVGVEAEAGNQPLDGKRMVVDVILNRVDDEDFPDTVQGVITQKYHFSSYWDGNMDSIEEISDSTYEAIEMELEERGWPGLLYFRGGQFSEYGTLWKKVGDHYFSTK